MHTELCSPFRKEESNLTKMPNNYIRVLQIVHTLLASAIGQTFCIGFVWDFLVPVIVI